MLISLDSHVRPPIPAAKNRNTELFAGARPFGDVDLKKAYELARGVARMQPDGRPGHRLVWARGTAFASAMLAANDPVVVVGRHTQCNVVLGDDPFVALRHLLVRSIALPSGGLALRVFDLHTELGFMLPDRTRQTSIFAEGPVAIAVGEYALVALPNETKDDPLPEHLPQPEMRGEIAEIALAMSPYRINARPPLRTSRITLMPRPVMVGEPLPQNLGRLVSGGRWGLTLSRGHRTAGISITEEDLVRGVMIGRSEKCHSEELRRITDVSTSRAHLMLVREGGVTYAYDLASTHGTFYGGERIKRIALSDAGMVLTLGVGDTAVRLFYQST
jgi:hypothetical protein